MLTLSVDAKAVDAASTQNSRTAIFPAMSRDCQSPTERNVFERRTDNGTDWDSSLQRNASASASAFFVATERSTALVVEDTKERTCSSATDPRFSPTTSLFGKRNGQCALFIGE